MARPRDDRDFLHSIGEDEFEPGEWTPRQRLFVAAYSRHKNGARAYREAGYKPQKPGGDAANAVKLQRLPHIKATLAKAQKRQEHALYHDAGKVLNGLAELAFFNLADLVEVDPNDPEAIKLNMLLAERHHFAAISEMTIETQKVGDQEFSRTIKIKTAPKQSALEALGKHYKLFTDKLEIDATVNIADRISEARRAARERRKAQEADDEI